MPQMTSRVSGCARMHRRHRVDQEPLAGERVQPLHVDAAGDGSRCRARARAVGLRASSCRANCGADRRIDDAAVPARCRPSSLRAIEQALAVEGDVRRARRYARVNRSSRTGAARSARSPCRRASARPACRGAARGATASSAQQAVAVHVHDVGAARSRGAERARSIAQRRGEATPSFSARDRASRAVPARRPSATAPGSAAGAPPAPRRVGDELDLVAALRAPTARGATAAARWRPGRAAGAA